MAVPVSVLLCASNAGDFLFESITSILEQSYGDFELVVIENASTDNTWDILNSFRDPRIRLYRTKVRQLSYNLNLGLEKAQGKWIARMDADDISLPDRLQKQMQYLLEHPKIKVLGTQTILFSENKDYGLETVPLNNRAIRNWMPFKKVFLHPTVVFCRETVLNIGGYMGGKKAQDLDLWLRLSRNQFFEFANLPEALLRYRIHPNQGRGSFESYAESSGYLLREGLIRPDVLCLLGSGFSLAKGIFKKKR